MTKPKKRKLHKNICVAFARLTRSGELLCRQSSSTEEAKKGGGYVYYMAKSGKEVSPVSAKSLIDMGLVTERNDGLFAGSSQSYAPISSVDFDAFRQQYEAPQNV